MGHIVVSGELESLEKTPETTSSIGASSTTTKISTSSSSPGPAPPPPLQQQSLTGSVVGKARRGQNFAGSSWHECVQSVCALLPSPYAERWLRCLQQVLHNEGPLPECWRIYIAILALCRHEVTWAVRALTLEFISADGDRKWLSGLRFAPKKLRALAPINNLLAHRPWLLTSQHILDLTKGEESWSFSELCQALCLVTHFHSFASFLHACLPLPPPPAQPQNTAPAHPSSLPLTPRASPSKVHLPSSLPDSLKTSKSPLDFPAFTALASSKCNGEESTNGTVSAPNNSPSKGAITHGTPATPTKASSENGTATTSSGPISIPSLPKGHEEQNGAKSLVPGSAKREIQASPQPSKQSKNESHSLRSIACNEEQPLALREFPHLCHDLSFTYEEFSSAKPPSNIFKIWEFNWQDHGYSLMTRLLNEMGNILDERFGALKTLSHSSWDRNKDGCYHYRKAVWNYIQSLFGIHHDDYLYSQIDNYIPPEVKTFIKKCCCRPESIEGKVPAILTNSADNVPSQLVPLSILIMEARMESELLYALRAVIPHQS